MKKALRSQAARDRILAAATSVFAREGFDHATIRLIAEKAAVNPAMVIRYYGSKEDLFAIATPLDFKAEKLLAVPRDRVGEALVAHVLARWEDPATGAALTGLLRASVSHDGARVRIVSLFEDQVKRLITALKPAGLVELAAPQIAAQMLGLAFSRYVLNIPSVVNLPQEVIVGMVGSSIQQIMDRD